MSEPTQFTADALALLDAAERDYHAEMQERTARRVWEQQEAQRVRLAVTGIGTEFAYHTPESMPIAPPVEDTVVKPVKHATVAQVAWLLIAIAAIWAVVVIVPVALLIGLFAFGSVACLYGLLVYGAVVLGLSVLIGVKGR